ncbi:MAG: hypothetical protein M3010_04110 [Candidatus Dormibacteraeota bacterium]|nr:hypothetical protein [Candidatus Dormibacteraeota bacterium]
MNGTEHRAARPAGYGWLISRATAMPLSPALFNSGLVGVVALAGALAWYALTQTPATVARLVSQ